jgi:hypothetical protein
VFEHDPRFNDVHFHFKDGKYDAVLARLVWDLGGYFRNKEYDDGHLLVLVHFESKARGITPPPAAHVSQSLPRVHMAHS